MTITIMTGGLRFRFFGVVGLGICEERNVYTVSKAEYLLYPLEG